MSNDDLNVLAAEYVLGTLDYEERKGATALLEVDPTFRGIVRIWEKRFGELHLMVEAVDPDANLWERIRPKIAGIEQVPPAIPSVPAEPLAPEPATETAGPAVGEATPAESAAPASAETELKLAELAALLPAATDAAARSPPAPATEDPQARAADQIPRGFVPPPPMMRRSLPPETVVVRKSSRGWMATSVAMGLIAAVLAGLIGAWRFFPDRLPSPLRVYSVLDLPAPVPLPPPAPEREKPVPFDE